MSEQDTRRAEREQNEAADQARDAPAPVECRTYWLVCDDCGTVTTLHRHEEYLAEFGSVPKPAEWEEFPTCLVCGAGLSSHWNSDPHCEPAGEVSRG